MKKYVLASLCLYFAAGCSDSLNVAPKDQVSADYVTFDDLTLGKLRIGLYADMEDAIFSMAFDFDKRSGNFTNGPGFGTTDYITLTPSDGSSQSIWQSAYGRINSINFLLSKINERGANTTATLETYRAEARYFRALLYFQLAIRWGDVPLLTKQTLDVVPQAAVETVLDTVVADLEYAKTKLPALTTANRMFLSKEAAWAMLARVYLTRGKKVEAIAYADSILKNTTLFKLDNSALTAYSTIFGTSSASNTENIFVFLNNNSSNRHLYYQQVNDTDPTWDLAPMPLMYDKLYADVASVLPDQPVIKRTDRRKDAVFAANDKWLASIAPDALFKSRVIKFPRGTAATPIIVSRFAEMYFIKAEAQGPGAAAATTLDPYFAARYTTKPTTAAVGALSEKDLQTLILDERRREFFGESSWWADVKRTGRWELISTPFPQWKSHMNLYPIPQRELDLAGYKQNPGY